VLSIRSAILGVVVLLVVCVGVTVGSSAGSTTPVDSPATIARIVAGTTIPTDNDGPVDVAFLGDSYTYGIGATERSDGYAYLVAKAEHWTAKIVGLPGSGYVRAATDDGQRIADGIPAIIAADPKVVIVECGHNDADDGINLSKVEPNAFKDLRRLRTGLPNTKIVVLGPVWLSKRPTKRAVAVRNAVHTAETKISNSVWIDPIAQSWFEGDRALHTGDDKTMINYAVGHPNDLGYQHIASVLEADLKLLKVR
jgi:lysophospholipase L1-like esterase